MESSVSSPSTLVEEENRALKAALAAMTEERDLLQKERDRLRSSYEQLKEHYALLKRRIFAAKAERVDVQQLELEFAETKAKLDKLAAQLQADTDESEPKRDKPKRKPKGRRALDTSKLPVERVELLDDELEKTAERIGFEESSRLGYIRGGAVHVLVARAKYKTTAEDGSATLTVVERPKELMKRGLLAPSLIARVLTAKYCYGLPFTRQVKQLESEGVDLDDSVMCRYAEHIGASLAPIVVAAAKKAKETAFCLSTDATGVAIQPTRIQGVKGRTKRQACARSHFFVVLADEDDVFFEYQRKENSQVVCEMFRGFSGYIQADAHAVYNALFRGEARSSPEEKPPDEVGCWSHCRRKFWEAAMATKEPDAQEAVLRIRQFFELEERWAKLPPNKRRDHRQSVLSKLMDTFFDWARLKAQEQEGQRGLTRTAFGYAVRHETALRTFLADGRLKITNNHSERALRSIAVGRKNWLFCGSDDHAESAAVLFSLIASCRLHKLEPERYLAEVIRVMPYWSRERYLELAPRYWAKTRARLEAHELDKPLGPVTVPDELVE